MGSARTEPGLDILLSGIEERILSDVAIPGKIEVLKDEEIWVADSGATSHCSKSARGGTNVRAPSAAAQGITGPAIAAESKMDLPSIVCDRFGQEQSRVTLTNVSCRKGNNFNLFSVGRCLINGWSLSGRSEELVLTKGEMKITFDIVVRTKKGALYCVLMKRTKKSQNQEVAAAFGPRTEIELARAHVMLGHPNFEATQATARNLGWHVSPGNAKELVCQACNEVEAKQKAVPSESNAEKATEPNGRLYHDLSTVKAPVEAGVVINKPVWDILTDERTLMRFTTLHKTKDAIIEAVPVFLKRLEKQAGKKIKALRQDNAGENKAMERELTKHQLECEVEYTAARTPQQNSLAETGFTVIAAKARVMQNHANLPSSIKYLLFGEAVKTATKLDWMVVTTLDGVSKSRVKHYCGKLPSFASYLKTFGEAGTVTTGKDGKVGNRGVTLIFVGYADKHGGYCYRMFNRHTRMISETRDVTFLRRMYYPRKDTEVTGQEPVAAVPNEGDDADACNAHDGDESIVTADSASTEPSALKAVVRRSGRDRNM
jgi:hypothetical protein